jgi:transglutaminase-like putative cysteine protease
VKATAYRVSHTTAYEYAAPVSICHNEARLTPRTTERQRLVRSQLLVAPGVQTMDQDRDYFGNVVHYFSLTEAHRTISVTAVSDVELEAYEPPPLSESEPWEEVRDWLRKTHTRDALAAREFTHDSPHARPEAEIVAYATSSFSAGRPLLEAVLELTERIHTDFEYRPGSTSVATPLSQVLATRRGVCQDFAHLEIAMLRGFGLPARYVSGYVYNRPEGDTGRPNMDASHAWLSVYSPRLGYVDFDPTNGSIPTHEHVTLGWGRDFSDVSPLKGVILGGGTHAVTVGVDMVRVQHQPAGLSQQQSSE